MQVERFIRIDPDDGTLWSYTAGYTFPERAYPGGFLRPGLVSEGDYEAYVRDIVGENSLSAFLRNPLSIGKVLYYGGGQIWGQLTRDSYDDANIPYSIQLPFTEGLPGLNREFSGVRLNNWVPITQSAPAFPFEILSASWQPPDYGVEIDVPPVPDRLPHLGELMTPLLQQIFGPPASADTLPAYGSAFLSGVPGISLAYPESDVPGISLGYGPDFGDIEGPLYTPPGDLGSFGTGYMASDYNPFGLYYPFGYDQLATFGTDYSDSWWSSIDLTDPSLTFDYTPSGVAGIGLVSGWDFGAGGFVSDTDWAFNPYQTSNVMFSDPAFSEIYSNYGYFDSSVFDSS